MSTVTKETFRPGLLEQAGARIGSDAEGIVAETFGEHCYEYARLFALSPKLLRKLETFTNYWAHKVENDDEISGVDAVEYISEFYWEVKELLAQI